MALGGPNIFPGGFSGGFYYTYSTPELAYPPDQTGLPTEPRVEPVTGVKAAYIIPVQDRALFTGVGHGQAFPYKAVDTMRCPMGHLTPEHHGDETHGCGFYAYETYDLLNMHMLFTVPSVILQVEHYGTTVSHKYGSRGQKQRVLSAHLNRCYHGDNYPPIGFALQKNKYMSPVVMNAPYSIYMAACSQHCGDQVSCAEMASMLGTEVRLSRIV